MERRLLAGRIKLFFGGGMELFHVIFDFLLYWVDVFLHLDVQLDAIIQAYGTWTYVLLFIIVFCETGLVVTPILPGDSLLFAAGTFAARGSLDPWILVVLLLVAGILGDAVNYAVGKYIGPKLLREKSKIFKKEYLDRTQSFYDRYGGKTIIFARFVPIVRTFAPFMAGVGMMDYRKFGVFNITGAILWVMLFVWGGYFFGGIPVVKQNFTLVILGIIFVSILPAALEVLKQRRVNCH